MPDIDLRDLVVKEALNSATFQTRSTEMLETLTKITDDHERRIRFIEKTISYGIGALGALKLAWDAISPLLHRG